MFLNSSAISGMRLSAGLLGGAKKTRMLCLPTILSKAKSKKVVRQKPIRFYRQSSTKIECYKTSGIEDEPTMNFDYVSFWIVCEQFLEKIRTNLEKRKSGGFMPGSGFVMEIFVDVCVAESADTLEHCQLAAAAAVADTYIQAVGDKYTALAWVRSEGKRQTTAVDLDPVPETCNQTADEEVPIHEAHGELPPFMTRAQCYDLAECVRRSAENRQGRRGRRA